MGIEWCVLGASFFLRRREFDLYRLYLCKITDKTEQEHKQAQN